MAEPKQTFAYYLHYLNQLHNPQKQLEIRISAISSSETIGEIGGGVMGVEDKYERQDEQSSGLSESLEFSVYV